jgi:hypothetical protein
VTARQSRGCKRRKKKPDSPQESPRECLAHLDLARSRER